MSDKLLHKYKTWVSFGDTDPAQRIYFVRIFEMAHRCAEHYALRGGFYDLWFKNSEWVTPVRHTEGEYFRPLFPGDELEVHMYSDSFGESSFTLRFVLVRGADIVAPVKTTHVAVNAKTGKKAKLPDEIAKLF